MKTEITTLIMCGTLVFALLALFWGGALLERRLNRNVRERLNPSVKLTSRIGLWVRGPSRKAGEWTWYVFGFRGPGSLMAVTVDWSVPWWRRLITRILLGFVWERRK